MKLSCFEWFPLGDREEPFFHLRVTRAFAPSARHVPSPGRPTEERFGWTFGSIWQKGYVACATDPVNLRGHDESS